MFYYTVYTCKVNLLYEFYYGFSNDMSLKTFLPQTSQTNDFLPVGVLCNIMIFQCRF